MHDFKRTFQDTLDEIEAEAKAMGSSMTQVCAAAGISRTTPDRWKKHLPKTVRIVADMQAAIEKAQYDKATEIPGEGHETI